MKYKATLRMLWGIAKSPELSMSDEELHLFVEARTGKSSLKELTQRELNDMVAELARLKGPGIKGKPPVERRIGSTGWQLKRIRELAASIGWDSPARVNGLVMKMFHVNAVEWLDSAQCSKLIEALKNIRRRMEDADHGEKTDPAGEKIPCGTEEKVAGGRDHSAGQDQAQPEKVH